MIIMLFGVSNVGNTVIGEKLAKRISYSFCDLDEEIKKRLHFQRFVFSDENDIIYKDDEYREQ